MNDTLLNLSGKVDPQIIEVLSIISCEAAALKIPFFVIGAFARDLILEHHHGITPTRKTSDIDLGIKVTAWKDFEALVSCLSREETYLSDPERAGHRVCLRAIAVDIVPFGDVSDDRQYIFWPPDKAVKMSVVGFKEAYESSISVMLREEPELVIRIPTLSGLALLKIISWNEKYPDRNKDALDLLLIINNYQHTGIEDRLYGEKLLLAEEEFDFQDASIRLLGQDMALIASGDTYQIVNDIFEVETGSNSESRLANSMMVTRFDYENQLAAIMQKLKKLKQGFTRK